MGKREGECIRRGGEKGRGKKEEEKEKSKGEKGKKEKKKKGQFRYFTTSFN
jgi:hypothetical protein